jgi:predicted phage-related endonuclease
MVGKVTPNTMMSASRLPALMGISKYRSPNDELLATIDAMKEIEPEDISNEAMEWGNAFEPEILKQACLRLGLDNLELDHPAPYFHASWPLACSLDGTADGRGLVVQNDPDRGIYVVGADQIVLEGVGVLEAKLTSMDVEDVPPLWRGPVQLQAQMDILAAKWGAVATLYRGTQMRIFLFAPHQPTLLAIEAAVTDFQRRLDFWKQTGAIDHYPPVDSKDADRTWPEAADEDPLLMGEEEDFLAYTIKLAKQAIKDKEDEISKSEAKLKALMREHSVARTAAYEIKWPMRHYKAQPERVVPAKEAYSVRQSSLAIKEIKS